MESKSLSCWTLVLFSWTVAILEHPSRCVLHFYFQRFYFHTISNLQQRFKSRIQVFFFFPFPILFESCQSIAPLPLNVLMCISYTQDISLHNQVTTIIIRVNIDTLLPSNPQTPFRFPALPLMCLKQSRIMCCVQLVASVWLCLVWNSSSASP